MSNNDDVVRGMRSRVEQCRRLADMIHDPRAREILQQMALEGERDIRRLEAENEGSADDANGQISAPNNSPSGS